MITSEVYVEIEILRRHGVSLRKIAEALGCAVNTVRSYLKNKSKPIYQRKVCRATKLAPYEDYLKARQQAAKPNWIRQRCYCVRSKSKVIAVA